MLMKKEVDHLSQIIFQPEKPYVAILGGKKVSDKITVIESLLDKVDVLLIGGAMSYTFFGAQGLDIGNSFVEEDKKDLSLKLLEMAKNKSVDLQLPSDHIAAPGIDSPQEAFHVDGFPIPSQMTALDIGPKTISTFSDQITRAKTIFWNGPMGVFEVEEFAGGTIEIAKAIARSGAYAVIGGGESAAAVYKISVAEKISHISTGGGASLEFITNGTLPGIEVLKES
jgi:phosphoglycerate kinase